jgi:cell division protein ZapA
MHAPNPEGSAMEQITLIILGREYRVACRPEERNELLACAHYLDQKMGSIRDGGRVLGADRLAVMAALQVTQELFSSRSTPGADLGAVRDRLRQLCQTADEVLAPQERLF